ncbi:MAG: 50S ribosomal protein L23 [Gemmatimonadota bacterium]|nr:MAG: 50S ribosomal protein L23 [Gemmatimonadota bacterium]
MTDARQILKRPLLTEKATIAREVGNEYVFEVARDSNRIQIKDAVESRFDVKVKGVRTVAVRGKIKRMGAHQGKRADWKKAYITLQEGSTIDLFEQM